MNVLVAPELVNSQTTTGVYKVYWVDAFTEFPFQGNPAVVVPEASGLSDQQMQQLAREVNCSETAFLNLASHPEADLRLRWFTPQLEVNLCGHATIAAMQVYASLHPATAPRTLQLETRSGILPVVIEPNPEAPLSPWIWLTVPTCTFQPQPDVVPAVCNCLGIPAADPQKHPRLAVVDSLNGDLLVAADSLAQLQQLQPNSTRLGQLGQQQGWRGICVYTQETLEPGNTAHLRFFAPHCGILEDPVTGSVSVPLVTHLQQQGKLPPPGLAQFTLEQGDSLGRAGRVRVDLRHPEHPRFGGRAVTLICGELRL